MREIQVGKKFKLREDGRMFDVKTGEEHFPGQHHGHEFPIRVFNKMSTLSSAVMRFFGPPKPGKGYMVIHKDNDNTNNHIDNLVWGTRSEAMRRRKDALPIGQRRCDFLSNDEYHRNYSKGLREDPEYNSYSRERYRNWRKENPEKVKARKRRYALTHPEKHRANTYRWYEKYPEKKLELLKKIREWEQNNKEKCQKSAKLYRSIHREEINFKSRERCRHKRQKKLLGD